MKFKVLLSALFLFAATLCVVTCADAQELSKKETVKNKKFMRLMKKENTILLDVRTPEEYASGHIPGAQNLDVQHPDFTKWIQDLDPSKRYLIYCRSGKRSEKALKLLKNQGAQDIYHLKEGIMGWKGKLQQ